MKRSLLIFMLVLLRQSALFSQAHLINIGLPDTYEYGNALAFLPDSTVLICAVQYSSQSQSAYEASDALLIRVNHSDQIVWGKKLASPRRDKFTAVTADAAGNIYVCGYYNLSYNSRYGTGFIMKLGTSGAVIWQRSFPATNGTSISDIKILSNGNIALAGSYGLLNGSNDALLAVMAPNGNLIYGKTYNLAFQGSPTNGDSFERVLERNNELVLVGFGRGTDAAYADIFVVVADIASGTPQRFNQYDIQHTNKAGLFMNNNYINEAYISNGELVIGCVTGYQWSSVEGSIYGILRIDMDTDNPSLFEITYDNQSHCNISTMYPVSNTDCIVMNMPANVNIGPEQDNSANPNAAFTNSSISRVNNLSILMSRSSAEKGIKGFNKAITYQGGNKIIATGISEMGNNQLGLQDILLMRSDLDINSGNECTFRDDTAVAGSGTVVRSWGSLPPYKDYTGEADFTPVAEYMDFSLSAPRPGQLGTREACRCFTDSIIRDSICNGGSYLLPTGQYVFENGPYITDTISKKDCSIRVVYEIRIIKGPVAEAGNDRSICSGDSIILTAKGTGTFKWKGAVKNGVAFAPQATAVYYLTASDHSECAHTDSVKITVNPNPYIDAGNDSAVCEGNEIRLRAVSNGTISWEGAYQNDVPFSPLYTAVYYAKAINMYLCKSSDSVRIAVNTRPLADAGRDTVICSGDSISLHAKGTGQLSWNTGIINGVKFAPEITATYYLHALSDSLCTSEDSMIITVAPLPEVDAGPDILVCVKDNFALEASGNAISYKWNNGIVNGVDFTFTKSDTFIVTGTSAHGCKASDTVFIEADTLEHAFYLPNSFSPDGNRINDVFYPGGQGFTVMELSVYNRWGELVYKDAANGWDGSYKGEPAQEGVYLVMLKYRFCRYDVHYDKKAVTLFR